MSAEQNTSSYDQTPECERVRTHGPHGHINTHPHGRSLATGRGSGREEITPHNRGNTQVSAEEAEIRVSSVHSSGSHRHWHTAYHQEHLSQEPMTHLRQIWKHGDKRCTGKKKNTLTETCTQIDTHSHTHTHTHTHTHSIDGFKRRGSEGTLLSAVLLSASTGPLDSRAHILYLICSRLALHNVNIILHYPGTLHPSFPWSCSVL